MAPSTYLAPTYRHFNRNATPKQGYEIYTVNPISDILQTLFHFEDFESVRRDSIFLSFRVGTAASGPGLCDGFFPSHSSYSISSK